MSMTWPYSYTYNLQQAPRPSWSSRCTVIQNLQKAKSMTFYSTEFQHHKDYTDIIRQQQFYTHAHLLWNSRGISVDAFEFS